MPTVIAAFGQGGNKEEPRGQLMFARNSNEWNRPVQKNFLCRFLKYFNILGVNLVHFLLFLADFPVVTEIH